MAISTKNFEITEFSNGALVLECGNEGMETDLVFASGAMLGDPVLKKQREILEFIMAAIWSYGKSSK